MPKHWEARDKKIAKRVHGMRVDNRSIFVVQEAQRRRDERRLRDAKKAKQEMSYA